MYGTPREIWKQAPENQSSQGKKQRARWPDLVCTRRPPWPGAGCGTPDAKHTVGLRALQSRLLSFHTHLKWLTARPGPATVSGYFFPVSITSTWNGLPHHSSLPGERFSSFLPELLHRRGSKLTVPPSSLPLSTQLPFSWGLCLYKLTNSCTMGLADCWQEFYLWVTWVSCNNVLP